MARRSITAGVALRSAYVFKSSRENTRFLFEKAWLGCAEKLGVQKLL
jgi:hypothetical protein